MSNFMSLSFFIFSMRAMSTSTRFSTWLCVSNRLF
jgi:hypothetical protein